MLNKDKQAGGTLLTAIGVAIMLMTLILGVAACNQKRQAADTVRGGANTVSLQITEAPEANATIGAEGFLIQGVLDAPAGFRSEMPIVFQIQNLETGWYSSAHSPAEPIGPPYDGQTYFDWQTGEFSIDGYQDFVLSAGPKRLLIWGWDAQDHYAAWSVDVMAESQSSIGPEELDEPRGQFLAQIADLAAIYETFLNEQQYDTTAFPYWELDLELAALHTTVRAEMAQDPSMGTWRAIGYGMEGGVEELLDQHSITTNLVEETLWREGLKASVALWRSVFEGLQDFRTGSDLGPRATLNLPVMLQLRQVWTDYFTETHAVASCTSGVHEDETPYARFEAKIYQSSGVGNVFTWHDTDPEALIPNSADPNEPVWYLEVELRDTNRDGFMDTLHFDGLADHCRTCELEALQDTNHYGHLVSPLRYLYRTRSMFEGGH